MIEFSEAGMAKAQIILKLSFFMPKNSSSCECKVLEGNLKCYSGEDTHDKKVKVLLRT